MMNTVLKLTGIHRTYGSRQVIRDLSLEVYEGERFFILGPSGCGKTTLLRIIAGLDEEHEGGIEVNGKEMAKVPPHRRNIGFVFQDAALWPHLTLQRHLTYAPGVARDWIDHLLDLTGLADRRKDYPSALSGGERQRLSLARALSGKPALLLLDEPLRNLDRNLAKELRGAIREILTATGTTSIFVTHDQEEALSMADRMLLLDRDGPVQLGDPRSLYFEPASPWAAAFFGAVNRFQARAGEGGKTETPLGPVDTHLESGTPCQVIFRASQVEANDCGQGLPAVVERCLFLGDDSLLVCRAGELELRATCRIRDIREGSKIHVSASGRPAVIAGAETT
jgi:ABC-type Fe3+/spermidine/putrescine transport system ATPase subunit